ncbi:hypothetical protein [Methylomicrobium sp. wino1]|uniref:hypothetical protein n=1 Tax=Methylotuvimicrobium sp. TaxID=2822413 RepID=UPI000F65064A
MKTRMFLGSIYGRSRLCFITHYKEIVLFDLQDGSSFGVHEARQLAGGRLVSKLSDLDEILIEAVILDELWPDVFADDDTQPLSRWKWHLGEIRTKTFPAV